MTPRLLALAAAGLLTASALAGCSPSGPATHPAGTGGSDKPSTAASASPSGESVDTGDDADSGTYVIPPTFPKDVPVIEGDVVYSADLGTGWLLWLAHDDFNAGYEDAIAKLKDAGFEGDTVAQADQGSVGQFKNDKYTIIVTSGDDATYGKAVSYTVTLN